eukprot:TRINITY_DN1933_c0_g2_i2.p1 TRINITY_DN1933_c0_g2~~TRINITY_DN1933_c0_g2_i2.p1  ORF type:complete len:331 (-),score=58.89 TRINITY_DN1933_c0_g2_i2:289-1281(-)
MTPDDIQRINLFEVLYDEAISNGLDFKEPSLDQIISWSEEQIRTFCKTGSPLKETFVEEVEFSKWFPGLDRTNTKFEHPKARVICFPSAGNAEDMFSSEGTGKRKSVNPLLNWCRQNEAELLSVQYPGRANRLKETSITSAQQMAQALLPILSGRLSEKNVPYVVVAHSMGCWIAFEFIQLVRVNSIKMPEKLFLSAMAAPDLPPLERPWNQQKNLDESQFKDECRQWDVNEVVFSAGLWPIYHQLMRSDFRIFDEYEYDHADKQPFDCEMVCFWGSKDRRISQNMIKGWQKFSQKEGEFFAIEGTHLWPLEAEAKYTWMNIIVKHLNTF